MPGIVHRRKQSPAASQSDCVISTFSISSPDKHLTATQKGNLSSQRLSFSLVPLPTGLTALQEQNVYVGLK